MNFVGTGQTLSGEDFARAAQMVGCEAAAIRAVTFVEARGSGFDAKKRPIILPERHVFYRNLPRSKRAGAMAKGLAYPNWKPGMYPATQDGRYQLLAEMMAIDEVAALKACSWGIGQVLGENYQTCGYSSPLDLVNKCLDGEGGQLTVMVRFIIGTRLNQPLIKRDWTAFARGYNGPKFAVNKYDDKLRRAYERFSANLPTSYDPLSDGLLSIGDKGDVVKALQTALGIQADGDFGKLTEQAVQRFQAEHGLLVDGKVGSETGVILGLKFWHPSEAAGAPVQEEKPEPEKPATPFSPTPETRDAPRALTVGDLFGVLVDLIIATFKGKKP